MYLCTFLRLNVIIYWAFLNYQVVQQRFLKSNSVFKKMNVCIKQRHYCFLLGQYHFLSNCLAEKFSIFVVIVAVHTCTIYEKTFIIRYCIWDVNNDIEFGPYFTLVCPFTLKPYIFMVIFSTGFMTCINSKTWSDGRKVGVERKFG